MIDQEEAHLKKTNQNIMHQQDIIDTLLEQHLPQHQYPSSFKQIPLIIGEFQIQDEFQERKIPNLLEEKDPYNNFPCFIVTEHVQEDIFQLHPIEIKNNRPITPQRKDSKMQKQLFLQETRRTKIQRYRNKKNKRVWDHKISYKCRKDVADNRERKNGRFIKKSPAASPQKHKYSLTPDIQHELNQVLSQKQAVEQFYL